MVNGGAEEANDATPAGGDTGDHVRDLGLRTDDGADHRALLSQAVSVTAALGVADELASGPRPVEEVAAAGRSLFEYLGHHPDAAGLFDGAMADLSRGWIAAVEDDGRVPLAEALLPDGVAPSPAKVVDLAMLAVAPGGRQRTEAEHRELLRRAGPRLSRVVPGDVYSLEEAVPAEPERRAS